MGYVLMAVPEELVPAVAKLVGEGSSPALGQVTSVVGEDGFVNGWDRETVRKAYRESADNMRELLRFLSRSPEREVSSYEIADAIGARFGWNTVAGMLGAFQRRCANHYGRTKPMWEFRYDQDDRILLTVPGKVAEAVRSAE